MSIRAIAPVGNWQLLICQLNCPCQFTIHPKLAIASPLSMHPLKAIHVLIHYHILILNNLLIENVKLLIWLINNNVINRTTIIIVKQIIN